MAIIGEREGLEIEYYQYPVVPGDDEWAKLGSIEKRLDACRIPKDILSRMTDEALLQAIYDFPFLCDMYVYTDKEYAVEMFEENCDAYAELLARNYSSSLGVYMGDKVFYGTNTNPTHSAVISSGISGAPLLTRTAKSKWGELGLFEHTVNNVPSGYDLNNVSVWHR